MRALLSAGLVAAMLAAGVVAAPAWAAPSRDALAMREEGVRLSQGNLPREAVPFLEKAVKLDPTYAEAWADLGSAQLALSAFPEAIQALERALALRADLDIARYNLAFALRRSGEPTKAAVQYRLYLERAPEDADAHYGLAEALRAAGDKAGAADAYEAYASVEKRPGQEKWIEKARADAKSLRAQLAALAPPTPDLAATGGDPAQPPKHRGEEEIERALGAAVEVDDTRDAEHPRSDFKSGVALLELGKYATALPLLSRAADESPNSGIVLAALGSAYLGLRRSTEAEAIYRRALAYAPPEVRPGIWLGIGEALRLRGERAEARRAFERARTLPASPPVIQKLAVERAASLE